MVKPLFTLKSIWWSRWSKCSSVEGWISFLHDWRFDGHRFWDVINIARIVLILLPLCEIEPLSKTHWHLLVLYLRVVSSLPLFTVFNNKSSVQVPLPILRNWFVVVMTHIGNRKGWAQIYNTLRLLKLFFWSETTQFFGVEFVWAPLSIWRVTIRPWRVLSNETSFKFYMPRLLRLFAKGDHWDILFLAFDCVSSG